MERQQGSWCTRSHDKRGVKPWMWPTQRQAGMCPLGGRCPAGSSLPHPRPKPSLDVGMGCIPEQHVSSNMGMVGIPSPERGAGQASRVLAAAGKFGHTAREWKVSPRRGGPPWPNSCAQSAHVQNTRESNIGSAPKGWREALEGRGGAQAAPPARRLAPYDMPKPGGPTAKFGPRGS